MRRLISTANGINLASFHGMLAKSLLQSSGLESQLLHERSPATEAKRRLIWNVFLLNYFYGQQQQFLPLLQNVNNPRFHKMEVALQHVSDPCPPLPWESYNDGKGRSVGIWGYMVSVLSCGRISGSTSQNVPMVEWAPRGSLIQLTRS